MKAGDEPSFESSTTPRRPPKPYPSTASHMIEKRPELVGGLPLYLALNAARQVRRFIDTFQAPRITEMKRRVVEVADKVVEDGTEAVPESDLPIGELLRKVADVMEAELATLRRSLANMKKEFEQSQLQLGIVRKELDFEKLQNAKEPHIEELSASATMLRQLLCKEQTRAAVAEKKLEDCQAQLTRLEKQNGEISGDTVKMSAMYSCLLVMILTFLVQSPAAGL